MRENDFEKQVRDKMEELGFTPAESVWAGVNKEINNTKKRRIPLFWLFFVSGLLLAGTTYYFIATKKTSEIISNNTSRDAIAKIQEANKMGKKQNEQPALQPSAPKENKTEEQILPSSVAEKNKTGKPVLQSSIAGENKTNTIQSSGLKKNNNTRTNIKTKTPAEQNLAGTRSTNQKAKHQRAGLKTGVETAAAVTMAKSDGMVGSGQGAVARGSDGILKKDQNNTETGTDKKKTLDSTAGKTTAGLTQNSAKKDPIPNGATLKKDEEKTASSGWEPGYTVGAGQSNLNQNLFNSVKTLAPSTNAFASPTPGLNVNTNSSSSEISPGFSFDAGVFVNRKLSNRFSFSAGLDYHYYSTTIRTGIKINTTLVTTNSINQRIVADSYYENNRSQTFTNQYHLIELPVSVNFQLNKNKRKPFIWELGLAPAYIFSSNALYYDPNTNVYFSNYLKPKNLQLNGVTALMFGLPLSGGQIQIGPQVQYGFTGFVNTKDGNPGHLFYAGLKISFIPGKK
jgi:hypothetical protein